MIFSLVQTKGGTGKTTLARGLAYSHTLQRKFSNICLVELDPQGSIAAWYQQRLASGFENQIQIVNLATAQANEIQKRLTILTSQHDLLILDVPGESVGRFMSRLALAVSDLVLFPMRSSTDDEQSFRDNLYPIIQEIVAQGTKTAFYILPTFVHPQTKQQTIIDYFNTIRPTEVKCLTSFLSYRSVFENYSRDGMNQHDYAKSVKSNARSYAQAQKAINDLESIALEIINI